MDAGKKHTLYIVLLLQHTLYIVLLLQHALHFGE
jgi:hypothetical protein